VRYGTAFGIGGVISTDHGATWLDRIPMDIATGANATLWDTGYPTAVQNADGTICVIGYYASVTLTTTNITRFIVTEDYVVNCNNVYDGCESFGTLWASHGVLATISPTHVHNGTNAIKIDNSGGSGGYATYQAWSANPAQATQRVAHSVWFYETANDTTRGFAFVDSTDSLTAPAHGRILETVVTATQHLRWYNGVAYQDTLVLEPENQWVKRTNSANVGPSSVTGQILVNNVVATSSLGMATAGAAPQYAWFVGGSSGTAHNVIYWLDDVYTHQYTANIPVTTTGSEQIPATGSVTLNPDTVAATATALLPTQAAGTIALRADTVAASAVAAAPGGATATGSFTLRADTVTCTVGPYYAITPSVVHPDPYHATTVS
jgi:hypothetical protein